MKIHHANILVALPAEAKPLTRYFALRRLQPDGICPVYGKDNIFLALCGPGVDAVGRGVSELRRRNGDRDAVWLNIGIAGHAELPLGRAVIAREVRDETGQRWPLDPWARPACTQACVQTVATPDVDYPGACAFDMEAAGFMRALPPQSPLKRVQVLKIISDNSHNTISQISGSKVEGLIGGQLQLIAQLIHWMITDHEQP